MRQKFMYLKSTLEIIQIDTTTKVKGRMDLICRTCLKLNLVRFNIFEYSQNARLVSDVIMELTSIKISENDELPVSICNKCLEKLNSAYDFKQMVIQSDRELFQLRQSKIIEDEKELQPVDSIEVHLEEEFQLGHSKIIEVDKELQPINSIEICVKTETEVVKTEQTEFIPCLSRIDETITEDVVIPNDSKAISIKQEDITNELDHLNDYDGQISISVEDKHQTRLDFNITNKCVTNLGKSIDSKNIVSVVNRKMQRRSNVCRKKTAKVNYDLLKKQVELIDNPDCKRIMESELSTQEKNSATVYCQLCDRTLTFRYYVDTHIHTHTGNLPFKCDECGLRVVNRERLKVHMISHAKTKEYICEKCDKAFAAMRHLKAHKVIHSNKRPYVCNICKKSFKFITALRNHELCHSSHKKFICEKCGKSYFHKRDLNYHQRTHSINKTVTCKTCGKLFLNKIALNDHLIEGHLTSQQLKCSSCEKEFACKKLLTRHLLTHKGVNPFSCNICGNSYTQNRNLERHMRLHTEEAPYSCKLCKANFIHMHLLKRHMKKHDVAIIGEKEVKDTGT